MRVVRRVLCSESQGQRFRRKGEVSHVNCREIRADKNQEKPFVLAREKFLTFVCSSSERGHF